MRFLISLSLTVAAYGAAPHIGIPKTIYSFEENRGQVSNDVRYTARGEGYWLFLTEREAVLSLGAKKGRPPAVLRMALRGGQSPSRIEPLEPLETRSNYLIGPSSQWQREVPHWGRIRYRDVYPGVDMIYYGRDGELEYDFVVAPGTSPSRIEMMLTGAESLQLGSDGSLRMRLGNGFVTQKPPVAYQDVDGRRRTVAVSYQLSGHARVGFRVADYDRSRPLVIDPLLVYSTFLGGERTDEVTSVAVDKDGNTYLAGETTSADFPAVDPFMAKPSASVHAFVTKINAAGDKILYSSFLGGDGNTHASAIAVDTDGNLYVTGRTGARNFPLVNPVQDKQTGLNIVFVAKLNPSGSKLTFSTYLGGERNDDPYGVALDDAGDIFVAGIANSSQFPTVNALYPKAPGGGDGFIAKFAAPTYKLAYSTYFGGPANDEIHALAVDGAGNAYVTGLTFSSSLGTKDAFQPQLKSQDAFVARLNADGSHLDFFSYLGGTGYERGRAIKVASDGSIWLGGYTTSSNFPTTPGAFQSKMSGDSDAFVSHLSADGQTLLYSTFLGGSKNAGVGGEEATAIALDPDGSVLAAGVTLSPDFPTFRKLQDFGGGKQDAFLVKFAPEGERVVFSTFLGGSGDEMAEALAVDSQGGVYVGGQTASADYPMKSQLRNKVDGANEGFLTKVCDPFLWASQPSLQFVQVLGRPTPEPQSFQLITCQPISFTAVAVEGRFLIVSPAAGKTNTEVAARADAGSFDLGEYHDVIRISSPDAVNDPLEIPVTLVVKLAPPAIALEGVVDAATGQSIPLTPGMVLEIHGSNLGPKTPVEATAGADGMDLSGTAVSFDGAAAKVIFTSPEMVRVIVPDSVPAGIETMLQVQYQGQISNAIKLHVAAPPAPEGDQQ